MAPAMLALSIVVGKLRLPLSGLGIESNPVLDVRLISTLLAVGLFAPSLRHFEYRRALNPALWTLLAFIAYMVLRSFLDPSAAGHMKQVDMAYVAVQAVMVCMVMTQRDTRIAFGLALVAFAAAYLFANLADKLIHFTGPEANVGLGWGPIGTAVTFNRIMFVGACASFIFAFSTPRGRWVFLLLATLFLYGGLASLQKAAAAFYVLSMAGAFGILLASRAWRPLLLSGAAAAVALVAFSLVYGGHFVDRLELSVASRAVVGATLATPLEVAPSPLGEEYRVLPEYGITHEVTTRPTQFTVSGEYCVFEQNPASGAFDVVCRDRTIVDRTSRPVLFLEALRGFLNSPLIGNGMGSYEVYMINEEHLRPDRYSYPHNLFFEVAYEGGGLGVALVAISVLAAVVFAFRNPKPLPVDAFGWAFITFMAFSSQFSGDLYDTRLFWLAALCLISWGQVKSSGSTVSTPLARRASRPRVEERA